MASDSQESTFFSRGCCCFFSFPCFRSCESGNWERISTSDKVEENTINNWWDKGVNAFKKVREWSELVAGPKWKTFIRRFNKTTVRCKPGKFHYDPLSYSLNFDNQVDGYPDFSSRYAPPSTVQ